MDLEALLRLCAEEGASDLHLLPNSSPLIRKDGALCTMNHQEPLTKNKVAEYIYSVMTEEQQSQFEKKLVFEMALARPDIGNFRVSIFHQLNGISAVFRIIPETIPTFEQLALPPAIKGLLNFTHGLILVTGPTGSGKSTTLAVLIEHINQMRACNIITIEDPIEFTYTNKKSIFNQLQIGRDVPDFSTALRASLRHDPNVILIGELRDLETMRLALTAAETGHLVLATMHSSSAPVAISRFADVFPVAERSMVRSLLSETLKAVICQTLVKKTMGGRIAAFEIMLATPPIRHFIRQDMAAHMESAMQISGDKGMCTMEQFLNQLINQRLITSNTAKAILANRGSFKENDSGSNV